MLMGSCLKKLSQTVKLGILRPEHQREHIKMLPAALRLLTRADRRGCVLSARLASLGSIPAAKMALKCPVIDPSADSVRFPKARNPLTYN
jgi:hypothetical protein